MTGSTPGDRGGMPAAADLLARWIGLDPNVIGSASIARAVRARMQALGIDDARDIVDLASRDAAERDLLVEQVVVGESWFFRDPQVFAFLGRFAATRAALPGRGTIRLLSVPCAAGEEPYSIVMALLDAGLAADRFTVDARDVSHVALERARQARYSANAFRNADLSFRDRWFHREGHASVLDDVVREKVNFAWANLLDTSFGTGDGPYDVVFCRNLLIYLTAEAREIVMRTLDRLVAPDGLLVLGAAEPPIVKGDWIPAADSSIFALRRGVRGPEPAVRKTSTRARASGPRRTVQTGGPAPIAAETAPPLQEAAPPAANLEEVLREAGSLANAGRYGEALACCEKYAREVEPAPQLFFMMGMLHQAAGDPDRAEGCFHKTLYLDASHDEALLSLALLAAQRGDAVMAEHYRQSAARVLSRKASS